MLIYLDEDEGRWLREMIDVYLTVVKRDESNQKLGRELINRLDEGLKDYKKGTI